MAMFPYSMCIIVSDKLDPFFPGKNTIVDSVFYTFGKLFGFWGRNLFNNCSFACKNNKL
jgi:hypothetical protein